MTPQCTSRVNRVINTKTVQKTNWGMQHGHAWPSRKTLTGWPYYLLYQAGAQGFWSLVREHFNVNLVTNHFVDYCLTGGATAAPVKMWFSLCNKVHKNWNKHSSASHTMYFNLMPLQRQEGNMSVWPYVTTLWMTGTGYTRAGKSKGNNEIHDIHLCIFCVLICPHFEFSLRTDGLFGLKTLTCP